MLENLLSGNTVNLLVALIAGISTFFASCLIPLVPAYLAYLSGVFLNTSQTKLEKNRWTIFSTAFFFVVGFVLTFIILGLAMTQFNIWLNPVRSIVEKVAGLLFIILGLFMTGIFKSTLLGTDRRFNTLSLFTKYKKLHAFITGTAFGFGWSPCIGPVLAVILYWSTREGSFAHGLVHLTAFGVGLGIPFLLVAAGFEKIMPSIKKCQKFSYFLNIFAGAVIVAIGLLMLTGQFQDISAKLLQFINLHISTF